MPLVLPSFLRPLAASPAAVLGGGVSGRAALKLLQQAGVGGQIYDEGSPTGEALHVFGPAEAAAHGLVIFSPGFAPDHPWLATARAAGALCLGELDFASCFWRGRTVAVTGTNGKTTLTEFLTHALRETDGAAFATGNVGHPFSRLVVETHGGGPALTAVCEVSSFQAESLRHFRADTVLWTNFAEDHLERHSGLEAYFRAKAVVAAQGARVLAGSSVRAYAEAQGLPADFTWVATENQPADRHLEATVFAEYPQRENFLLAAAWWRAEGRDEAALLAAARTFRLGRHRLARVAELDGVTYWNDSKATNFHAVEAALGRFEIPVRLIAGGKSKGGDLAGFVRRIAPKVREVFLVGETGGPLAALCAAAGVKHRLCASLEEAVRAAAASAEAGDHVLLSPGFASFDQFRGYADRGEQFEQRVREIGAAATLK